MHCLCTRPAPTAIVGGVPIRSYELELAALDGLNLSDREMDLTLGLVIAFVPQPRDVGSRRRILQRRSRVVGDRRPSARPTRERRGLSPRLAHRHRSRRQQGSAHDPELAYTFGLDRIADGVQALRNRDRKRRPDQAR